MRVWVFGYGSLIWRPDIDFIERRPAKLSGWQRRFWQGSHDHRGLPEQPGRVVTLVPEAQAQCEGMAYLVAAEVVTATFETLDYREKNGYERFTVELEFADAPTASGVTYIAPKDNFAYLGPAPLAQIAAQIQRSAGPSGRNLDYLFDLANALRAMDAQDPHVFELEAEVRALLSPAQPT